MAIICPVDYSTALSYKGMNLSTKYNNKKHKVFLKLNCDDYTLEDSINLARISKNILMLNYEGLGTNPFYTGLTEANGIYIGRVIDFGNNITEEDVERIQKSTPAEVVPIINLPDDYKDLQFVWNMSKKFSKVRFSGGMLFSIEGTRIGAIGIDILDKAGIKYDSDAYTTNGRLDVLDDVDITTLDIKATLKPERVSKERKRSSSNSKSSSKKKTSTFEGIFNSFSMGGF